MKCIKSKKVKMRDRNDRRRSSSTSSSHVSWTLYFRRRWNDDCWSWTIQGRLLEVPKGKRDCGDKHVRTQQCKHKRKIRKKRMDEYCNTAQTSQC